MTSSKDVETGKYLACNQAFADFADRRDPEAVIGLTDRDIFDSETAAKFVADDEKALSMDQPYVFYEDVPDAVGNLRQFQTTKLKFTDTTGRLCTLCMRLDYTELMRAKAETEQAKTAYEKARSASTMYSSIAHTLSTNYVRLYYVDLETGRYTAYKSADRDRDEAETQGEDFFSERKPLILARVHRDDRDAVDKAFTRENILDTLAERDAFTLTYRRAQADGKYAYANLQARRMQDDDHHVMIGIGENVDIEARNELTGLHTKAALYVCGKELLRMHPDDWCVLAIDLEHFKLFNEWYGREMGDRLLAQIGELLVTVENTVGGLSCYLGQDDFALVAPYDEEKVKQLFGDIHEFIMEWGTSVGFLPAIGVCMADGKSSVQELLDRASQASQHAKEDYHHRIRVFEESMYQKTERDYQILSDFQQALKDRELFIMLQPQCQIVSMAKTMESPIIVEGVETKEETEFIKSLGCRYVQGYYFYKPMPVPDFEGLIGDEYNIDTSGFTL